MEATGYSRWFERLLAELGFELWIGDPAEIKGHEITRFKGLGEMQSVHLRETTMDVTKRTLLKVDVPHAPDTEARRQAMDTRTLVENLMGRKPEKRYAFIQEHAKFARDLDV